jgi:hypothetical protein
MNRMFVHSQLFDRKWIQAGLTDKTLQNLQEYLIKYPDSGPVIRKTKGLRKIRWNKENQGKRGGIRVFYVDFPKYKITFLLTLIEKNDQEDLTPDDYHIINKIILNITDELEKQK